MARAYWAEVFAEGPANGETVRVLLGTFQTPYRGRVLRWLRGQARRIADGLDPDPRAPWIDGRELVPVCREVHDVPEELRHWCDDDGARQAAYDDLGNGDPFTLTASDDTARYFLAVIPVNVPSIRSGGITWAEAKNHRKPRASHWLGRSWRAGQTATRTHGLPAAGRAGEGDRPPVRRRDSTPLPPRFTEGRNVPTDQCTPTEPESAEVEHQTAQEPAPTAEVWGVPHEGAALPPRQGYHR